MVCLIAIRCSVSGWTGCRRCGRVFLRVSFWISLSFNLWKTSDKLQLENSYAICLVNLLCLPVNREQTASEDKDLIFLSLQFACEYLVGSRQLFLMLFNLSEVSVSLLQLTNQTPPILLHPFHVHLGTVFTALTTTHTHSFITGLPTLAPQTSTDRQMTSMWLSPWQMSAVDKQNWTMSNYGCGSTISRSILPTMSTASLSIRDRSLQHSYQCQYRTLHVSVIRILGVTFTNSLSVAKHIQAM